MSISDDSGAYLFKSSANCFISTQFPSVVHSSRKHMSALNYKTWFKEEV